MTDEDAKALYAELIQMARDLDRSVRSSLLEMYGDYFRFEAEVLRKIRN